MSQQSVRTTTKQQQQQPVTATQSMAVVKNCIRLAISTVAFKRNLFSKDTFASKVYAGVSLEVLRPFGRDGRVVNADAFQVHEWIENGAFKALELGYLDKLALHVLDQHPDLPTARVLESYTFTTGPESEMKSNTANRTISTTIAAQVVTKEDVQDTMQRLIKTLVMLTSSLPPLPPTRWLSMSITYNASAPQAYEAPDFAPQDPSREPGFGGAGEPLLIPVGEVRTGLHKLALEFRQQEEDEHQQQQPQPQPGLDELQGKMTSMHLAPPPPSYGRVKRPLQQLSGGDPAGGGGKKTRAVGEE